MRVAMFSPLSPAKSAISDYTEGLLPYLSEHLDVVVVTTGDYRPTSPLFYPPQGKASVSWIRYDEFQRCHDAFDLVVYQLGDEATLHGYMFDALRQYPGLVILHDLVLHHAIVALTLGHGDRAGYVEEMRYSYGDAGPELAAEVMAGRGDAIMSRYPLVERVLDHSLGIIAHNSYVCSQVRALRPGLPVDRVVQHFFLPEGFPPDFDGGALRRELGLAERPVVMSCGFFIPDKRLGLTLSAFKRLLNRHPDAVYLLVGGSSPYYDLQGELRSLGLADRVRLTGWLAPVPFVKHMHVGDVAVHLRYPHIGGTPYTPIRLLGLSVPTIVSDIEPLQDLPANCLVRVPPDDPDEEMILLSALDYLLSRRDIAREMARNGREYVLESHCLSTVGRQYVETIRKTASRRGELEEAARERRGAAQRSSRHGKRTTFTKLAGVALADMGLGQVGQETLLPLARAIKSLQD